MLYLEGRDNIGLKTGYLIMHQWCSGNMRSSHGTFTIVIMAALRVRLPVDTWIGCYFSFAKFYHIFVGSSSYSSFTVNHQDTYIQHEPEKKRRKRIKTQLRI